jgi:hypothetical protein
VPHRSPVGSARIGIRTGRLPSNLDPFFERDADPVLIPPDQPASGNGSKGVERDVKTDREQRYSIRMDSRAGLRDIVSDTSVQLAAAAEEQQAVHRSFDHLQSNPQYIAALALAL